MTRRRAPCLGYPGLALLAAALAHVAPAVAQTNSARPDRADSVVARRSAASAQARFESIRRQYLPRVQRIAPVECDRRIGRLCYWYDPHNVPPDREEDARIAGARVRLLVELAELRERSPYDGWISGQRVRYLIEAGLHDSAYAEARRCESDEWWCAALSALALHASGRGWGAADAEFQHALELAPADLRCEWESVELHLPPRARRVYRRLECGAQRDSLTDRFWWLSNPRLAQPHNELRAEHYARHVMARIQDEARNPYGMRPGSDLAELLVRYGWSRRYTRSHPRPGEISAPVAGHETVPSFHFTPNDAAFAEPFDVHDDLWDLESSDAASRYAPRWATHVQLLDAQLAALRRGDEALIVAAFPVPQRLVSTGWHAELGASRGPYSTVASTVMADSTTTGVMTVTTLLTRTLVGVDLLSAGADSHATGAARRDTLLAARTRQTLVPPGANGEAFAVSTPLLLTPLSDRTDANAEPDISLESILSRVRGGTSVAAPGRVAIYWEAYGLPSGRTPLEMTLVVRGGDRGWLRRLGDRITGRTVADPPLLAWTDLAQAAEGSEHGVVGRSVTIELPSMAAGSYALEIRAVLPDGRDATAVRLLEVQRSDGR